MFIPFLIALLFWLLLGFVFVRYFSLKLTIFAELFVAVWFIFYIVLTTAFSNDNLLSVKTGFFLGVLCFTGLYDYQTKTIPKFVHWLIFLCGLMDISRTWILGSALPGLLILPIPVVVTYLYFKKHKPLKNIGVGDIKLIVSCGFVLGIYYGLIGLLGGLIVCLGWSLITGIKGYHSFPFAPFLCIGFTASYLFFFYIL